MRNYPLKGSLAEWALFVIVSIFATASFTPAAAATIYVPDDYTSIQAALDAASPGDTIIVRDGTYTEVGP